MQQSARANKGDPTYRSALRRWISAPQRFRQNAIQQTAAVLFYFVVATPFSSVAAQPPAAASNIEITHDDRTFVTTLRIHARDGEIAWRDLVGGMAKARGYDESELLDVLPPTSFKLNQRWTHTSLFAMNRLAKPYMKFTIRRTRINDLALEVALNRLVLLESKRRFKKRIQDLVTLADFRESKPRFGIELLSKDVKEAERLFMSIHGFNAFPEELDGVLKLPMAGGISVARFAYPNDQPIDDSAKLLSEELLSLRDQYPRLAVSLVTHSMGGLVARRALEDKKLDPHNVDQLIMIAPPNHGSELANFAFAMDLWQLLGKKRRRDDLSFFYTSVEDGLAEAATDLQPNSIFLTRMSRAKRNPDVRYSIFLGNKAPLGKQDVDDLRKRIHSFGENSRWSRFFGGKVESMIAELDELVDGMGDGVVSVNSGKLEGVDDTVVMPFSHTSVLRDGSSKPAKALRSEVLERLELMND